MSPTYKKVLKGLLIYLPLGLFTLAILANFYLGISKMVTHNPAPMLFGVCPLAVMSGSMEPAIDPGDVVIIREQAAEAYKMGDIATYLSGGTLYTHRIVRVENGLFIMKGDSNNTEDDAVAPEQLIGKVQLIVPKIGYAIVFAKTPAGMTVLALMLFLAAYLLPFIGRTRKKSD